MLDPEGKPVSEDFVTCIQEGGWFPGRTRTDESGAFVVGPLAPGTCVLVANEHRGFAGSGEVTAAPGQIDVVLRLQPAGKISGRVVDAATGEPCAATVHVTPEHEPGSFLSGEFESDTRGEGRFLLENLPPDRYHLWFATTDGRFGTLSGIPVIAGKESGDHVVKVVPGGTLVIRYEGKERSAGITILSGSDHLTFGHSIDIDQPETKRVPAGRITIEYTVGAGPDRHSLSVDVGVGETREVVLKDSQ